MPPWTHRWHHLGLAALLAAFLARIVLTYTVFNDTFDENLHIRGGIEILQRGTYTLEDNNPPLGPPVIAALPYFLGGLRLNEHNELWHGGVWSTSEPAYFWKTLTLARAGNLVFAAIIFFLVWRWSLRLYGPRAALGACFLLICSPTLIAHCSLATLDAAAAATFLAAAYCFWRWSERPRLMWCAVSGVVCGLAWLAKYSALIFVPALAVAFFLAARRFPGRRAARAILLQGAIFAGLAFLTVWAGYGFEIGTMVPSGHRYVSRFDMGGPRSAPNLLLGAAGARRLPAHRYAQGLIELLAHNITGHRAYLLGKLDQHGWWYYFPFAVAVKTTLPLLMLASLGVWLWRSGVVYPALAVAVVIGSSMPASLNIGVRHMLAVYPFFAILGAGALASGRRWLTAAALVLAAWHGWESVRAHPDYLAYFNQIARGREEKFLLDSNLDWGQDLARLGRFAREKRIDAMHLRYFGTSSPAKMGVPAREPWSGRPQSGWVAVSVNYLYGLANDPAEFDWLRARQPDARVGKSIWVYRLP